MLKTSEAQLNDEPPERSRDLLLHAAKPAHTTQPQQMQQVQGLLLHHHLLVYDGHHGRHLPCAETIFINGNAVLSSLSLPGINAQWPLALFPSASAGSSKIHH
ncbi:hypothetical protein [Candidatus Magnetaquicoccus inordinatus]|uniref:hypothetical protein n=1 Tax=Candidatus Magnetaquicoccus inordinatus TaxID=2496818 RepID=UPI00102B88CD|nr:hypothetical protein [Candidatus Magnetaquicoccus inordinatus]